MTQITCSRCALPVTTARAAKKAMHRAPMARSTAEGGRGAVNPYRFAEHRRYLSPAFGAVSDGSPIDLKPTK